VSKTNDKITRTMAIRTKRKMMKPFRLIFLWLYCIMVKKRYSVRGNKPINMPRYKTAFL
jgi:hypothetical protein